MKPRPRSLFRSASLATLATICLTFSGHAASLTWDGNGSTTPNPDGGDGTWDVSATANWWNGLSNTFWLTTGTDNDAVFGNTAGTVTLTSSITVNDLTFNTTGYILTGAYTLTVNGTTPTIRPLGGVTATIGNNTALVLAGTAGLTKEGGGTLTLNGSTVNTFTGGLFVNWGTLNLSFANLTASPNNNLINSGNTLTLAGGTLTLSGKNSVTSSQTFNGLLATSGASTLSATSGSSGQMNVVLGAITRSSGAVVNFSLPSGGFISTTNTLNGFLGTWATTGTGSSTRYITLSSGNFAALTGTAAGTAASLTDTAGTANYDLTDATGTVQDVMSANSIRYTGAAGSTAPGATSFSVNGLINAGTGVWTIGTNAITIGADQELVVNTANNGITINSAILNNGSYASSLTKVGTSTLILGGANSYTGTTTINSGNLNVTTGGTLGASTAGLTLNGGGVLDLGGSSQTVGAVRFIGGGGTIQNGTLSGSSFSVDNTSGGTSISAILAGSGGLTKTSDATSLTLTGANTYTGTTTVSGGNLLVSGSGKLGASSAAVTMTGGTLNLGTTTQTVGVVTISGASNIQNGTLNGSSYTASIASGSATVSAILGGSGGFVMTGAGTVVLSGSNTYTGKTSITNGTLSINTLKNVSGGAGALGAPTTETNGTIDLDNGTLEYTGAATSSDRILNLSNGSSKGTLSNNGSGTLTLTNKITGLGRLVIYGYSNIVATGLLDFTGGLTRTNGGVLTLNNAANSFGNVAILDGTISVNSIANAGVVSALGAGSSITLGQTGANTNGKLVFAGASGGSSNRSITVMSNSGTYGGFIENTVANQTLTLSGNVTSGGGGTTPLLTLTGAGNGIMSGNITGTGLSITKDGASIWTLSGNNGYTGATTVTAGTLEIGGTGQLGNGNYAGAINIAASSTLLYNSSATQTLTGQITLNGTLEIAVGQLNLGKAANTHNQFGTNPTAGTILIHDGGKLVASTQNAHTMFHNIVLRDGGTFSSSSSNPTDWGTYYYDKNLSITGSGSGNIVSANSLGIHSDYTLTLATNLAADRLAVSSQIGFGATATGGALAKTGAGMVTLTGASTYSGGTTVSGGTLVVNNSTGSGTGSGAITVNSGATLAGSGILSGVTTIASGGILAPGNSVGTLTLGSLNLASGSTAVYEFKATPPTNDLTVVTASGGLTINGGAFTLLAENTLTSATLTSGNAYNLIQYNGAIGGLGVTALTVANPVDGGGYAFGTSGGYVTLTRTDGKTWDSEGGDNNWSSASNWAGNIAPIAGDVLVFGSGAKLTPVNDFEAGTSFGGIVFNASNTAGFTLSGNAIDLTGAVSNNGGPAHTININLALQAGAGVFNTASDLTVGGIISGSQSVTKTGSGKLTLSAANTYTGATNISLGTLELAGSGQLGSGTYAGAITNYGSLLVNSSANQTLSGVIAGSGTLTKSNSGTLTLSGINTYTGTSTVNGGTLEIGGAGKLGNGAYAGAIALASGATLNVNTSAAQTLSGAITGAGSFTKSSSGTLTLSGLNTFTGAVNVNAGMITSSTYTATAESFLGGPGTATNRRVVNIASGAQIEYTGGANSFLNLGGVVASGGYGAFYDFNIKGTLKINDGVAVSQILQSTYNLNGGAVISNTGTAHSGKYGLLFGWSGAGGGNINVMGSGNQITADRIGFFNAAKITTATDASLTISSIIKNGNTTTTEGTASSLIKEGPGLLVLTNRNEYTGATTINGGTLTVSGALGTIYQSDVTINGGGTLKLDNNATVNHGNRIGTGSVTMNGGTLDFYHTAGTANYVEGTGALSVASGSNTISTSQAASGQTSTLTFTSLARTAGATINFSGTGLGVDGRNKVLITTNPALPNGIIGGWATYNGSGWASYDATRGVIAYTGYTPLTRTESGTKVIANNALNNVQIVEGSGSTFANLTLATATTTISTLFQSTTDGTSAATIDTAGKTLRLGAAGGILTETGAGMLTIGTGASVGVLTAGGADNTAGEIAVTSNAALFVNSVISNNGSGAVSLSKGGTATMTLNGINTYTGSTAITAGILEIGGAGKLGNGSYSGAIALSSGATLNVNTSEAQTLSGAITGAGALTKNGTNTVTLSSASTAYTGATTVNSGTLTTTNTSGFASTVTINTNATLRSADTAALAAGANFKVVLNGGSLWHNQNYYRTYAGLLTLSGNSVINATNIGNVTHAYFDGGATGSGNLTINNTGDTNTGIVFRNAGTNSLTGSVTVNGGLIGYGVSANALSGAILNLSAATLQMTGSTAISITTETAGTVGSLNGDASSKVLTNTALTVGGRGDTTAFAGIISGSGSLIKTGNGTMTLSGANTFTGSTTVSGGTLALGHASALANSTLDTGSSGSQSVTFTLAGSNTYNLGNLQGSDDLAILGNTISVGAKAVASTFSGAITGTGGLTKVGNGMLTLSGTTANTYTGMTNVTGLRGLVLSKSADVTAIAGDVTITGTTPSGDLFTEIYTPNDNQFATSSVINFTGTTAYCTWELLGTTQNVAGVNATYRGIIENWQFGGTVGGFTPTSNTGTLVLNGSSTYTFAGRMRDVANVTPASKLALTMSGIGTQILSGVYIDYTGDTTINSGTLKLTDTTAFNSNVTMNGGTLELSGTGTWGISNTITAGTGSGNLVKSGAGTVTLNGINTYSGTTTVKAGTLALGIDGSIANSTQIVVGDAGPTTAVLDTTLKTGFTIVDNQTLSGIGTVNVGSGKTLTIADGGIHAVGNASVASGVGSQTVTGNLSYASGSIFEWNLNANSNTGKGTNYDAVTGSTGGELTVTSGAIFKVVLGNAVDLNDTFWSTPNSTKSWGDIFSGFTTATGGFNSSNLQVIGGNNSIGSFTISGSTLTWTAVPEPSSVFAGLLLGAGLLRRRRRNAA